MTKNRHAILYRMVLSHHSCPYGVRAKEMLEEAGYGVEDRVLCSREDVDAFQNENDVASTPQIFGDDRIGGCDELELYLIREQSASEANAH